MGLFFFSKEFTNSVALPMLALFLGTGNATPEVPSIIMERLITSPTFGIWYPGDRLSVVKELPPMVVFPNLSDFYETWKRNLIQRGIKVRLLTKLTKVLQRDRSGVLVQMVEGMPAPDGHDSSSVTDAVPWEERYDEIVLCVLADQAKELLAKTATFWERRVLGSANFSDDITVTHSDNEYMERHYENFYNHEQAVSSLSGVDQTDRLGKAKDSFKPMYLIKTYAKDPSKLEMCFDCSNYQAQFPPDTAFKHHVFQTIFLNKDRDSHLWNIDEIDQSKVIREDWWHQLCHSWTHFLFVVPWVWLLQGRKRTRYAASWTLLNAHEVAVISGIAAAVDLGAKYPEDLERDHFALLSFRLYYLLAYGRWYKSNAAKSGPGKDWAGGIHGSVYQGPGVAQKGRMIWREDRDRDRSLQR